MLELCAIILAAGKGSRMGSPKALLPWADRTLAVAHAQAALSFGATRALVVTRDELVVAIGPLPAGATHCISHEPDEHGAAGSLIAAMRSADSLAYEWFAVCPVDVAPDAWSALPSLVAARTDELLALRPTHHERRGHPVLVHRALLAPYGTATATPTPLRELLRARADRVLDVAVTNESVLTDFDTPAQLEAHSPCRNTGK